MKTRLRRYLEDLEREVSMINSPATTRHFLSSKINILFNGKKGDCRKMLSHINQHT